MPLNETDAAALLKNGQISQSTFDLLGNRGFAQPMTMDPAAAPAPIAAAAPAALAPEAPASWLPASPSGGALMNGSLPERAPSAEASRPAIKAVDPSMLTGGARAASAQVDPLTASFKGLKMPSMGEGYQQVMGAYGQMAKSSDEAGKEVDAATSKRVGALEDLAGEQKAVGMDAQQMANTYAAVASSGMRQLEDLQSDIAKQKIDPDRVWHGMGVGSKITAAISIGLGSLGGAMTGQGGNVALDIVNKAIDRDIEAQKMEMQKNQQAFANKSSLLSTGLKITGDVNAATLAAKNLGLQAFITKGDAAAAQIQGTEAKMRWAQTRAQAMAQMGQNAQEMGKFIVQRNMFFGAGGQTAPSDAQGRQLKMSYIPDEKAKDAAMKELPEYEKHQLQRESVAKAMKDMYAHRFAPRGTEGYNTYQKAATLLDSNTSELYQGKSESEFEGVKRGLHPGLTWTQKNLDEAVGDTLLKLDSQKQFPTLEGYHIVPTRPKAVKQ